MKHGKNRAVQAHSTSDKISSVKHSTLAPSVRNRALRLYEDGYTLAEIVKELRLQSLAGKLKLHILEYVDLTM